MRASGKRADASTRGQIYFHALRVSMGALRTVQACMVCRPVIAWQRSATWRLAARHVTLRMVANRRIPQSDGAQAGNGVASLDAATRLGLHKRRRPLAFDLRDVIAQEFVFSGEIAAGEKLPSEHALSARYGVSRVTVRAALHGLREAGLVSIRQGVGATVLPRQAAVVHGLDRLGSIETFARESGQTVSDIDLKADVVSADEEVAERLEIELGTNVMRVSRTKCLDGTPVGWIVDYVPEGVVPFDTLRSELMGSALDVLIAHPEVGIEYADAEHIPVALPADIAEKIGVDVGTVALHIQTVVWTSDGQPVDWAKIWLLPAQFRFVVRRRIPVGI